MALCQQTVCKGMEQVADYEGRNPCCRGKLTTLVAGVQRVIKMGQNDWIGKNRYQERRPSTQAYRTFKIWKSLSMIRRRLCRG